MLKGKTVVLGVTGSIAAYKTASLASSLVKLHADVHVLMTQNATNFINPITFETLTGNKCLVDTFDRNFQFDVTHVSLAKKADVMLIAPASANVIGKIAGGIADDMLTTTVMASTAPVLISPAMNTHMYENPIVQDNLEKLLRAQFPDLSAKYVHQFALLFLDLQKKCDSAEISTKALDLRGMLDALRLIRRGIPAGAALDMGITNKAFDSYEQGLIRDVIAARIPAKLDAGKLFA